MPKIPRIFASTAILIFWAIGIVLSNSAFPSDFSASSSEWRNIRSGYEIPDQGYCDQPYIVKPKRIKRLRLYNRYLRTSEAIQNFYAKL